MEEQEKEDWLRNIGAGKLEKSTIEIYQHYGLEADKIAAREGKIDRVDFLVGKEEDIQELTRDMAGFGTQKSQKVIIEYDKGYGYFIVKRIFKDYGASKETP